MCEIHNFETFLHIKQEEKFEKVGEGEREESIVPLFSLQDLRMWLLCSWAALH